MGETTIGFASSAPVPGEYETNRSAIGKDIERNEGGEPLNHSSAPSLGNPLSLMK
jgi:hypothetical protein